MAILANFEVTILAPKHNVTNGMLMTTWEPISEHDPPYLDDAQKGRQDFCQKYVGVVSSTDTCTLEPSYEFAIDFKVYCGFTFTTCEDADTEFIVFRAYLDGEKIGTAHVKRKRWERSGTYRVRKKSRRFWVEEAGSWIESKWGFDPGLHGTLKIEVWKQGERAASSGSWDHPDWSSDANWAFVSDFDGGMPKPPRVRHTTKVGMAPMATFVYEYRSHGR